MSERWGRWFRSSSLPTSSMLRHAQGPRLLLGRNLLGLAVWSLLIAGLVSCGGAPETLVLATTTSTADSGLLDALLPAFEQANQVKVEVVAVGTGQALALGERGDADVILVHDAVREAEFMASGHGVDRREVMYNDFVILGPLHDPAGVAGLREAGTTFARIAQAGMAGRAIFLSRGDKSGTHGKEMELWRRSGIQPQGTWYKESGQGMGETLTMASELRAYTLSDRATYLSRREKLDQRILVEGDPGLLNFYGVMAVSPQRHPHVQYALASKFIRYMTSFEGQERIAQFGKEQFGQSLFFPNSEEWKAKQQ